MFIVGAIIGEALPTDKGFFDGLRRLLPEQRLDALLELLERHRALQPHTVE
jgi:hypothetical protein